MRTATTICISLPQRIVDQLREGAKARGMTFSGFAKIVIVSGMESPLGKMLQETDKREEVEEHGTEV